MDREQAAAVIAAKIELARRLVEECEELGREHDISVSFSIDGSGPTMENLDHRGWMSSSERC